jgi:hypothetical protein
MNKIQKALSLHRRAIIRECLSMGFYSFLQMRKHVRKYESMLYGTDLGIYK